jgi:hypothetical protein
MRALWLLALVGCQDDISTPFPPGLEPFEDDAEAGALEAPVTEGLTTRSVDDDFIRVYGRGLIFASPATVYAVAHDPAVMVAVCSTTSQTTEVGNDPAYDLSFLVHYFVDDILNVEWDDQWRGDVVVGTVEDPELVQIKHQKIEGSDFISLSEGTVQLLATDDPDVTELRFVEHLDAIMASEADVILGMQSNFERLLAVSHGDPIPPSCLR